MERMLEIMGGKCKKCPNSKENLLLIAVEFGNEAATVSKIFLHFNVFTPETKKHFLEIFEDLFGLAVESNPLTQGIAEYAGRTIEGIFSKFEEAGMTTSYGNILKMMCRSPDLINYFLQVEVFENLSKHVSNPVFDISSEALSIYQEILISRKNNVEEVSITRTFYEIIYLPFTLQKYN